MNKRTHEVQYGDVIRLIRDGKLYQIYAFFGWARSLSMSVTFARDIFNRAQEAGSEPSGYRLVQVDSADYFIEVGPRDRLIYTGHEDDIYHSGNIIDPDRCQKLIRPASAGPTEVDCGGET